MYEVVWKDTGQPYRGSVQRSEDEEALKLELTQIMEIVSGLRGKLEVRKVAESEEA